MVDLLGDGFLLLVGLGLLIVGVADLFHSLSRQFSSKRISGTVVAIVSEEDCYLPKVEFSLSNGKTVTFTSKVGRGKSEYSIGDQVSISLNERYPENSEITSIGRSLLTPIALILLSTPFIVFNGLWWK